MSNMHRSPRHKEKEKIQIKRIALQRTLKKILAIIGAAMLFWFIVGGDLGVFAMIRSIRYKKNLERLIEQEEIRSEMLSKKIKQASSDTFYIEQIARTKYGMVNDNEMVFIFADEDSSRNIFKNSVK